MVGVYTSVFLVLSPSSAHVLHDSELDQPAVTAELVNSINRNPMRTWTASIDTPLKDASLRDIRSMCGAKLTPSSTETELEERSYDSNSTIPLPASFDWREHASKCPSITEVRDQANCGNCWAVSSSQVLSDRVCLASNGSSTPILSGQDITSCAGINGCEGADLVLAWEYIHTTGVVTGGPYGDKSSCFPYQLPHCTQGHGTNVTNDTYPPCGENAETPACPNACVDDEDWASSKVRGGSPYYLTGESNMMQELVQRGPLTVTFSIYDDFPGYQSGIYDNTSSRLIGGHAVGLYGYGVESGTKYWLLKNLWNEEWGEGGWFRIVRGKDSCDIESGINARCRPAAAEIPKFSKAVVV